MSLFGLRSQKRTRTALAGTIGASSSMSGRIAGTFHDRGLLLRLMLCVVALAAMLAAVHGWKKPFTYRKGDWSPHGVLAAVEFEQVNDFETRRARSRAEERVPFCFRHDPKPLAGLADRLRADLETIAGADSVDDLPDDVRNAFGLAAKPGSQPNAASDAVASDFNALKRVVGDANPPEKMQERLDQVLDEFERLIAPVRKTGILASNDLSRHRIPSERQIAILEASDQGTLADLSSARIVSIEGVLLNKMLLDSGDLADSWQLLSRLAEIRAPLSHWLLTCLPATLQYDSATTKREQLAAREQVLVVNDHYNPNDVLVDPGSVIGDRELALLHAEYDAMEETVSLSERLARGATVLLMLAVLATLLGYYLARNEPHLVRSAGRLSVYLIAVVATVFLGRVLSFDPWRGEVIPLIATVMVVAIAYNQVLATLTAFALSLILTFATVGSLSEFVVLMSVSATAVIPLASVPSRSRLIKVGFGTSIVCFVVSWGVTIIETQSISFIWTDMQTVLNILRQAGWCLAAGYLVAGSLPFIESLFGVVTDISLLEMSDISHPVLQELARRAPGTYNHSIAVATIAEAAADSIGANGLLVRVGAYFHDIGKMLKPHYFIENLTEHSESRHNQLAPAMSTLIIIGHVKDGVDLARQHNLPQRLIDFIEQHHGTTLVQYFFHEATKKAEERPDHRTDAEESSFRYPGPKPQTPEAGVLLLADAVESASRTLNDPTPKRIENLVHSIAMKRLMDGQFDECSLTLRQLRTVEESLTKSLISVYHGRIQYPEQRSA